MGILLGLAEDNAVTAWGGVAATGEPGELGRSGLGGRCESGDSAMGAGAAGNFGAGF